MASPNKWEPVLLEHSDRLALQVQTSSQAAVIAPTQETTLKQNVPFDDLSSRLHVEPRSASPFGSTAAYPTPDIVNAGQKLPHTLYPLDAYTALSQELTNNPSYSTTNPACLYTSNQRSIQGPGLYQNCPTREYNSCSYNDCIGYWDFNLDTAASDNTKDFLLQMGRGTASSSIVLPAETSLTHQPYFANSGYLASGDYLTLPGQANLPTELASKPNLPYDFSTMKTPFQAQHHHPTSEDVNLLTDSMSSMQHIPSQVEGHSSMIRNASPGYDVSAPFNARSSKKFTDLEKASALLETEYTHNPTPSQQEMCTLAAHLLMVPEQVGQWFSKRAKRCHSSHLDRTTDSAYATGHTYLDESPARKRVKTGQKLPVDSSSSRPRPDRERRLQCTSTMSRNCSMTFGRKGDWKRHEEIHFPQSEWKCGMRECVGSHIPTFIRKDKLLLHLKEHHNSKFSLEMESWRHSLQDFQGECGFCGESFTNWNSRNDHIAKHFVDGKDMSSWQDPFPRAPKRKTLKGLQDDQAPSSDEDEGDPDESEDDDDDDNDNCDDQAKPNKTRRNDSTSRRKGQHQRQTKQRTSTTRRRYNDQNSRRPSRVEYISSSSSTSMSELPSTEIAIGPKSSPPARSIIKSMIHSPLSHRFVSRRELGQGTFGRVDEVLDTSHKMLFARKTINLATRSGPTVARREVASLRQLKHPHIIQIFGCYIWENKLSMILSPVADCKLSDYMRDSSLYSVEDKPFQLSTWFSCLASSVSHMHKNYCWHMDLKPDNILIYGNQIIVTDFSSAWLMSKLTYHGSFSEKVDTTPVYCAPEIFAHNVGGKLLPQNSEIQKADIFSLGCIYLEMVTTVLGAVIENFEKLRLWQTRDKSYHANQQQILTWIDLLREEYQPTTNSLCFDIFDVVWSMLDENPSTRPNAAQLQDQFPPSICCHSKGHQTRQRSKTHRESKNKHMTKMSNISYPSFQSALNLAKGWISECDGLHTSCHCPNTFLPTRLLDVGFHSNTIYLKNSEEVTGNYITLSHCWGNTRPLLTTSENLQMMHSGISTALLPPSFKDAVSFTRMLGIRYLWIDCFCIIQNCIEDWNRESVLMAEIYGNAFLTIAATSTPDKYSGFRDHRIDFSSPEGPASAIEWTLQIDALDESTDNWSELHDHRKVSPVLQPLLEYKFQQEALFKRAWTLQETVLSRRTIYFTTRSIIWRCRSALHSSEPEHSTCLRNWEICPYITNNKFHSVLTEDVVRKLCRWWHSIIQEYTKRELTYSQDKLVAISGLANAASQVLKSEYLAGLWSINLLPDLLWSRSQGVAPSRRPRDYRAPSWSWASIDSPVRWPKSNDSIPHTMKMHASVMNYDIKLSSTSKFGQVSGGALRIRGPLAQAYLLSTSVSQLYTGGDLQQFAFADLQPFVFAQLDVLREGIESNSHMHANGIRVEAVWCLGVLDDSGLVLVKLQNGLFERIGVYVHMVDERGKGRGKIFGEECTIVVV